MSEFNITVDGGSSVRLPTAGKYCDRDIVITAVGGTSGGTTPLPKEVNFYDYDGTLLYSYTIEEAQALTELPALPTHEGLNCQGWNYELDTIKSYNSTVNVGAVYITDDGNTRLYIRIATEGRMTVPLCFSQTVANGVIIDWGDGSDTTTLSGTGNQTTSHTYASIGDYVITLKVASGTLELGNNSSSYSVMGATANWNRVYCNMLQKVEIGSGVTSIGNYAFYYCYSLASVVIPNSVARIGYNAFYYCYSLASIVIPNGVASIGTYAFYSCYSLASVVIPNSVTRIGSSAFQGCHSLASITMPNSVTRIDTYVFAFCYGMAIYDFSSHTSVPTLANTNAFTSISSDCIIKVPASLYDEWTTATNWATYASQIVAV